MTTSGLSHIWIFRVTDVSRRSVPISKLPLLRPPLLYLLLTNLPQLVNIRRLSCNYSLGNLNRAPNSRLLRRRILRSAGLDADDTDTGILWATIVGAIAEVT